MFSGKFDDLVCFGALQHCEAKHMFHRRYISHFENGEKSNHLDVSSIIFMLRNLIQDFSNGYKILMTFHHAAYDKSQTLQKTSKYTTNPNYGWSPPEKNMGLLRPY